MIQVKVKKFGDSGNLYWNFKLPISSHISDLKMKINQKDGISIDHIWLIENSRTKILDDDHILEDNMLLHLTLPFRCISCPEKMEYYSPFLYEEPSDSEEGDPIGAPAGASVGAPAGAPSEMPIGLY